MKLVVYKGFSTEFLSNINTEPLVDNTVQEKRDVLNFDNKYRKKLKIALISLDEEETVWITYEEYSFIKKIIDAAIEDEGLVVEIYKNNLYPDYYPIEFDLKSDLIEEITSITNKNNLDEQSEECKRFFDIYSTLHQIDENYFASFYNYEYDNFCKTIVKDYYPSNIQPQDAFEQPEYNFFINNDVETYLRDLDLLKKTDAKIIGIRVTKGDISNQILKSLEAYCTYKGLRLINSHDVLPEQKLLVEELKNIAIKDIGIANFKHFRDIEFYKNPDISKEVVKISQSNIISEIIHQAENAYDDESDNKFRDIFITASTGAGKSVMFQIPAVYLAKKYGKLTIIIEPVKALMQDQKEKLNQNGYNRVEVFNSDLITQVEKEAVLKRIKNGEVDLLYLSPETLLSYSLETIIGDREVGLLIIDEAHIVTTWGVGFRPDYWYLGSYINRLRNPIQTVSGMKRKIYKFPICAFTATAVNGGEDDSIGDTIVSLYMENPVKFIGYVRREDIIFQIEHKEKKKLSRTEFETRKGKDLNCRLCNWLKNGEKTIVYFPYASIAADAYKGIRNFSNITSNEKIGLYTGRNIDNLSIDAFNEQKHITFESFRNGKTPVMFATKAFGMGVDVDDVKNVYHYAATGNLCDYVQEIGRAARNKDIEGVAITDYYNNDLSYMNTLFGMSQIKQYQIKKVLEGVYNTYLSKNQKRNFLISPEAFTYIFNGKKEDDCINKLKTCLLMIEKDLYDKYVFKVLISRPQSVFTKAFICVHRENELEVKNSKYAKFIKFEEKGRVKEKQIDGSYTSDGGDIYVIDLKGIWENYYQNMSFPSFKYWYFNSNSTSKDKVNIMPEISQYIHPRQKIIIKAKDDELLCDLREKVLDDFEYIGDKLYSEFGRKYFTLDEFTQVIQEHYGKRKARIIANSLFDLIDPQNKCVKYKSNDLSGKRQYQIAYGNIKEYMRRSIKADIIKKISFSTNTDVYSGFVSINPSDHSSNALKVLSVFDYITYEVLGGKEPEIFIRLNDPNKIRDIVYGNLKYSNAYVTKAKAKHDRDTVILKKFFESEWSNKERWDYIEEYFLGYDLINEAEEINDKEIVKMTKVIDKEHSYQLSRESNWENIKFMFDDEDFDIIDQMSQKKIPIPEYLSTVLKHSDKGQDIMLSWPSKNTLICQQDTSNITIDEFLCKGWNVYRLNQIDFDKLKKEVE